MTGIDFDSPDCTLRPETDDGPVVSRAAAALGFPSVAHVGRVARHDQVVARSVEHVAARDHGPAMLDRSQVDIAATAQPIPVGHDFTVNTEPRHPAIRKDTEPQVRRGLRILDRQQVVGISLQRSARQDLAPPRLHQGLDRPDSRQIAGVDRARLRIIAGEKRGMNVDPAGNAACAQPDDAPVVRVRAEVAAPARLPAIHPLAALGVFALAPDRSRRLDQVLLRRKELVVRGDDRPAEAFRGKVDQVEKWRAHSWRPPYARTSLFLSHIRSPRTNVVRIVPNSDRPA